MMVGLFEPAAAAWRVDGIPRDFSFGEIPPDWDRMAPFVERAISRESGAEVGGRLWADTLGPEGSSGATYVDAIEANAAALAEGMSGGRVTCAFSR